MSERHVTRSGAACDWSSCATVVTAEDRAAWAPPLGRRRIRFSFLAVQAVTRCGANVEDERFEQLVISVPFSSISGLCRAYLIE
jgi:hypothetical protein